MGKRISSHLFRLCRLYKTMPQELYAELWDNVTVEVSKAQVNLLARKEQIISNKVYHL
jgi:hypothetical protein